MEYYTILHLNHEPFSNAPDPDFFFPSFVHHECIQKIELAVRLQRGLNVVSGRVGTGKTTICRALLKRLAGDTQIEPHLFLDPFFTSPTQFLARLLETLTEETAQGMDDAAMKERLKQYLFEHCVDRNAIPVVIIDEGQKLPGFAMEILRELLNYETNDNKLLQIVIFAQPEFETLLQQKENVRDRINLFYRLNPLTLRETIQFIKFRINKASAGKPAVSFTLPALWQIHSLSGGYPRKIINLCHQALLALVIQDKTRVTRSLINVSAERSLNMAETRSFPRQLLTAIALAVCFLVIGIFAIIRFESNVNAERNSPHAPGIAADNRTPARAAVTNPIPAGPIDRHSPEYPSSGLSNRAQPASGSVSPEDHSGTVAAAVATPQHGQEQFLSTTTHAAPSAPSRHDAPRLVWPKYPKPLVVKSPLDPEAEPATLTATGRQMAMAADTETTDDYLPANSDTTPPEQYQYLGEVTVTHRDTLYDMIRFIYGYCTPARIEILHRINSHVTDPDIIEEGIHIRVPMLNRWGPPQEKGFWVSVGDYDKLNDAYTAFRRIQRNMPEARLLPWTNDENGLTFSILLANRFESRREAETRATALAGVFNRQGTVISNWGIKPVFFTPPWTIMEN
ncbi:MAG: AAA family ATPase [Thermodesulfobacteriota bacterium]|nr:AAA family ATPase [Thermodesulfobacteriota bacterium]